LSIQEIIGSPVLFCVAVMDYAIKNGRWRVLGNVELEPKLRKPIEFFMQDIHTGEFSIYKEGGLILPAKQEDIFGLERAAAWEPEHVEDRLRDYYSGVPNKWLESLKPRIVSH
jgi:hypothetical protein